MTLRLRLVLALLALLTVGLTLFGVVTYRLYSRAEYDRLDERMLGAVNDLADLLSECRDFNGPVGPDEVYAVLIKPNSPPCRLRMLHDAENQPDLNLDQLMNSAGSLDHRYSTVDSLKGSTHWRVLVHRMDDGSTLVVALPTTEVKESLARLVGFETFAGAGLAALLAVGSWLIMRRGLHPLEQMAATASTITAADDLSVRVAPDDDRSEVGQLGGALNTMLGKLEGAFAEQEATEQRLRQFLADASHELRTPLTSIQGFAELFRLGADQDETDRAVTMRRIEQETARMRTLVDDLLLLARLDQTRPLERAPVDLAVLAADS
ncbi:MAG TPA: histidine kinase dimerization/phospho-acceptor domain-containing protein, partial [Acidimicrobiales bacterium]